MIRPAKGPAGDVALCAAVAGVTGLVYSGFYAGWPAVPVILGAAAVPALLVLASVRPGWSPGRAAALAGAGLALYPVLAVYWGATSAGLPGPAALGALGRGLVDGWAEMLPVGPPADASGDFLVAPVVLTGAASAAASVLAVHTSSPLAPLGPPALAFVVALALVAGGRERQLSTDGGRPRRRPAVPARADRSPGGRRGRTGPRCRRRRGGRCRARRGCVRRASPR